MNGDDVISPAILCFEDNKWRHFGEPLNRVLWFREIYHIPEKEVDDE